MLLEERPDGRDRGPLRLGRRLAGTGAVKRFRLKGRAVRARAVAASARMASGAV
jgi:hypothetical protein